jgi:hypothetical protein
MPPFRYTPNQNRYVGSIADLMGRGNEAEAQALIASANAQARAAQASGQAWGGAVQGIGNTIAAIPGQMQAAEDRARVMEERERADRTRAMDAEIFNPASMIGPTIPDGTLRGLPPTTPGIPGEGPGSMAGDFPAENVASGLELNNPYKTKNANGSSVFDRGKIIETYVAAGLDPPNLAAFDAFNESVTRNYDEYLQQSRIMAADLLKEPPETWSTGALTILDVLEDNGIFTPEKVNAARRQLKAAEGLEGQAKIDAVGQLIYRYSGQETPETKFVSDDAVGVSKDYLGNTVYTPVTAPSDRPRGKPTAQTLNGRAVNVWWDADGVARDRHGTELIGDILPASAAERFPTPGSVGDLVITELDLQAEQLGRELTSEEKATTMQQVLDRNREGQLPLLPGEFSSEKIERIDKLMRSLRADPVYRGMLEINGAWQALQASYSVGAMGLGDIAMINSFQRMIDPGVSVREGDVNLISAATSLLEQLDPAFLAGRATVGARMPAEQRARMIGLGRAIYAARLKDYQSQTESRFRNLAVGAAVPFELIAGEFEPLPDTSGFRFDAVTPDAPSDIPSSIRRGPADPAPTYLQGDR